MLFNTLQFFVFFVVVLALFYSMPRPWRKWILLAASYYFYASWNAKFIALLLTLTVIDYASGIWLERVPPGPRRKAATAVGPLGVCPGARTRTRARKGKTEIAGSGRLGRREV